MRRLRVSGSGRALVLATATLVALLAAGCGDDVASDATAEPTSEATAEATATEELTLTVQVATAVAGPSTPESNVVAWTNSEFGVTFGFELGEDPFLLSKVLDPEPGLVVAWSLVRESELSAPDAFGPRGMTIEVFEFASGTLPGAAEGWVRGSSRSNFGLGDGELKARTVGGVEGVRYSWSGLHEGMSVVVQVDGRIWMFTMLYREDISELGAEFGTLLDSVVFAR